MQQLELLPEMEVDFRHPTWESFIESDNFCASFIEVLISSGVSENRAGVIIFYWIYDQKYKPKFLDMNVDLF